MYVTISPNNMMYKYSFNWRNDSGELDVFEAAQYFSSAVDDQIQGNIKFIGEERQQYQVQRASRMSLDSIMRDEIISSTPQDHQAKDSYNKNKKYRALQPIISSPGGKLASFLNSLFNQTISKKKRKSQSINPKNLQEKETRPGERLREIRRSSISHFRSINTKNVNLCFMQLSTPTKPAAGKPVKPKCLGNEFCSEKDDDGSWWIQDQKLGSNKNWMDDPYYTSEEKEFRKFSDGDDGGDTDSSSDLFELPNCDFEFYQTTRVNSIRRGHAPL
ncbi:protein BIG GRAIN 1-like E [Henckelia pumila]|uniref:protein BIG GRAIN 1-like E n=1 Tax=Henckelia pumila TaxID=405737 RepID=UPI003C6E916E